MENKIDLENVAQSLVILNPDAELKAQELNDVRSRIAEKTGAFLQAKTKLKETYQKFGVSVKALIKREAEIEYGRTKINAIKLCCEALEKSTSEADESLDEERDSLSELIKNHLYESIQFMKNWNCTRAACDARMNAALTELQEWKDHNQNIERELQEFRMREEEYSATVANKQSMDEEMYCQNLVAQEQEQSLTDQLYNARCEYTDLKAEKEKLDSTFESRCSRLQHEIKDIENLLANKCEEGSRAVSVDVSSQESQIPSTDKRVKPCHRNNTIQSPRTSCSRFTYFKPPYKTGTQTTNRLRMTLTPSKVPTSKVSTFIPKAANLKFALEKKFGGKNSKFCFKKK